MSRLKWRQTTDEVIRTPVKTRFQGVPAEEAGRLYAAFRGEIEHFYGKASQAYVLGITDNAYMIQDRDGLKLRYINNQGNEIVEVKITAELLGELEKKEKDHWDWALIEIRTPHTNITHDVLGAIYKAFRKVPGPESGQKYGGFCYSLGDPTDAEGHSLGFTDWSDGLKPSFSMSFAPEDNPIETIVTSTDVEQITSLLVDLRHFPGMTCVIDLYGWLLMDVIDQELIIGYRRAPAPDHTVITFTDLGAVTYPTGWPFDPNGNTFGFNTPTHGFVPGYAGTFAPYDAIYQTVPNPHGAPFHPPLLYGFEYYIKVPGLIFIPGTSPLVPPAATWNRDPTYHFSGLLTGITQTFYFQHFDPSTELPSTNSFLSEQVYTWDITPLEGSFPYSNPATRVAPVSGAGGKGWPTWVESLYDAPYLDFAQWDIKELLPGHIQLGFLGNANVGSNLEIVDTLTPYKFLGTVTIDPVLKSISFLAAK